MPNFYFFDTLSSTMDEGRARAYKGAKDGDVIVAKHQTQGRGRRGRNWESFSGNLHMTYIAYLNIPMEIAPQLSLVSCVGICEELCLYVPETHEITYKWPNDILLNGKKVGGILLEAIPYPDEKNTCYLIGCGLNLNSFPEETRYPATSFKHEGIDLSIDFIQQNLASSLERYIQLWRKKGFEPIRDLWLKKSAFLEAQISVEVGGQIHHGILKGIDAEGAMLLQTQEKLMTISVGEVL